MAAAPQKSDAPNPPASAPAPKFDADCIFMVPDIGDEKRAADVWMMRNAPDVPEANLVSDLHLRDLNDRTKLYFLLRKPKRGVNRGMLASSQPFVAKNEQGYRIHEEVLPEDLAEQFGLFGPIVVAEHWDRGAGAYSSGTKLRRNQFMSRVGDLLTPWTIGFVDHVVKPPEVPMHFFIKFV